MIDLSRRGFLFGAVATVALAPRTFHLLPPVIERGTIVRKDDYHLAWRAYRSVECGGVLYDIGALASSEEAARRLVEGVPARRLILRG